jgi:hypothetical protein
MTRLLHKFADSNCSQAIDVCKLFDIVPSSLCADVDVPVRLNPEFLSVKIIVPTQKMAGRWACVLKKCFHGCLEKLTDVQLGSKNPALHPIWRSIPIFAGDHHRSLSRTRRMSLFETQTIIFLTLCTLSFSYENLLEPCRWFHKMKYFYYFIILSTVWCSTYSRLKQKDCWFLVCNWGLGCYIRWNEMNFRAVTCCTCTVHTSQITNGLIYLLGIRCTKQTCFQLIVFLFSLETSWLTNALPYMGLTWRKLNVCGVQCDLPFTLYCVLSECFTFAVCNFFVCSEVKEAGHMKWLLTTSE